MIFCGELGAVGIGLTGHEHTTRSTADQGMERVSQPSCGRSSNFFKLVRMLETRHREEAGGSECDAVRGGERYSL